MPNIKSVVKDVKKSRELRVRNLDTKSRIKTFVKKSKAAMDNQAENTGKLVNVTISIIDSAAKRGIIHANSAARRKSRLMKRANLKAVKA